MAKKFFVNYGGPGGSTLTTMKSQFDGILQKCVDKYGGTPSAIKFTANGLNVTINNTGIHRSVEVELPDSVLENAKSRDRQTRRKALATINLYGEAMRQAADFDKTNYHLLGNNCVSAVSNVLNVIDPSILGNDKKVIPSSLDSKVKNFTKLFRRAFKMLNGSKVKKDNVIPTMDCSTTDVPKGAWDAMTSVQHDMKQQLQGCKKEDNKPSPDESADKGFVKH